MSDFRLKVSAEDLQRGAQQIESQITGIEKSWNRFYELAGASRYYWEGDASDYRKRLLEQTRQDLQAAILRLKECPVSLLKMAGVYVEAEKQAAELINALPDNVLD